MKKISIVLILIVVVLVGYYVFGFGKSEGPAAVPVLENESASSSTSALALAEIPKDAVSGVRSYRIKKPTNWASLIEYSYQSSTLRRSSLIMMSPGYHDGPDDAYPRFEEGTRITVMESTESPYLSVADLRASRENSEMYDASLIESLTVAGEPAIRYYWTWEGQPLVITTFFRNGRSYSIDLAVAEGGEVPEKFAPYMSLYEAVIDSFEFE